MKCPSCDHENIPGSEQCDECGLDLAGLDVEAWDYNPEDPLLARSISTLAIKEPIIVRPDATVTEVVKAMLDGHQGCVLVTDEQNGLVGVFTERDLAVRVAAPGRDADKTLVQEVMTRGPVALHPEDPLAWALHRMAVDGYRHLPLLEDGRVAGLLSVRAVLASLSTTR